MAALPSYSHINAQPQRLGSHRFTINGDRVVIHDLELFVGYDHEIDGDDKQMKKYDREGIQRVVDRTNTLMQRGQRPVLIRGHNSDEKDQETKPAIGTIQTIARRDIAGAPGIVGDVEMTAGDFEYYLKSNAYPRRSAEIWPDGFMSEVALLGSETPARPLPDTHFSKATMDAAAERFSRDFAPAQFQEEQHPGPSNVYIPDNSDKRKAKTMAEQTTEDPKMDELKKKLKASEEECKTLKTKLSKYEKDDEETKEENRRLHGDVERFQKELDQRDDRLNNLTKDLTREKFTRLLETDRMEGYPVGGPDQFNKILDHIIEAKEPQSEYDFLKGTWQKSVPVHTRIDQEGASTGEKSPDAEKWQRASDKARDRCTREGAPQKFAAYLEEELKAE